MKKDFKYREIPYNYTSFSDREIILKYLDQETWDTLNALRKQRVTGRSAKLLFEVIGDLFIIDRNPYIFNDYLENPSKLKRLKYLHRIRIQTIEEGAAGREDVLGIMSKVRELDRRFFANFRYQKRRRRKILMTLGTATSRSNIFFTAFHKVMHVTDATDWRVEYPEVVVYPESVKEIMGIVRLAGALDLKIIPRGGGTGLTGGAVPVYKNTMVINLEKMRNIEEITFEKSGNTDIPVVEVDAGVVTDRVNEFCLERGYVFATDPTSAWASTIGGNIAENCGGKKAVMWGTAIDNLFSFQIINSEGLRYEVVRKDHPHRKILPEDSVVFDIYRLSLKKPRKHVKSIELKGTDIRKKGVGKDITNKALGGVPGLQKEGGDGIIVSAKFVLYRPFEHASTLCLEFFGSDMRNASKAIVETLNYFDKTDAVFLTALEHFDEKYVKAINYRNKSRRDKHPKAVLVIDVESNDDKLLAESCSDISSMMGNYEAEAFIASDETARELFWKDRKNLGAIARHTNAFKLNEDVVIPIEALPEFADYIEKLNMRKELSNIADILNALIEHIGKCRDETDIYLTEKINDSIERLTLFKAEIIQYVHILNRTGAMTPSEEDNDPEALALFNALKKGEISIDINERVLDSIERVLYGYDDIRKTLSEIHEDISGKKLIVATHMHAGDGNIHVNIPVHSNDYPMMMEADETAGEVMIKTKEVGGVISGEHGIGLTKLKYIDQDVLDGYAKYKKENDPDDIFNPGKLTSDFPISMIYTPSMNLLKTEAFILEAVDLRELTSSISACVRCGKCKEVCNTNYPEGGMLYSPRNKVLGVSLITEAVLYDVQTQHSLSFRNFIMLREISDHCTVCHKCLSPCPVDIDFGEVSLAVKKLLVDRRKSKFKLITWVILFYLRTRGYYVNKAARLVLLKFGFSSQRLAYYINRPFRKITAFFAPKINYILSGKFKKSGNKPLREILGLKNASTFYAFSNPEKPIVKSVVYFPGCGSERMFPEISISVIALLYNAGVRVVIPPEYLCCGYPILFNGKTRLAEMKSNENRVIFHRMADLIGYMDIEDVLVSCGTCFEMLDKYQIDNIFPGASVSDINEFIAREKLYSMKSEESILYHDPCHSPLKKYGAEKTFENILGVKPVMIPNCCGEGGTMALSSPEISNTLRKRKRINISGESKGERSVSVITTCPSCVQGLSKISNGFSVKGEAMAEHLAEVFLGKHYKRNFIKKLRKDGGVEEIVF